MGANTETRSVVGNFVDNIEAVIAHTDGEVVGVNAVLVGSVG